MLVYEAVAAALADCGVDTIFGVVGSGNFHVTSALVGHGARYIAARHEGGAATMADAWARQSGRVGVLSVHQGPGLTNALTGITEAAKSSTPLLVLAPSVSSAQNNFRIDVAAVTRGVGATPAVLHSPSLAIDDAMRAYLTAMRERRTVVLAMPLDVQTAECIWPDGGPIHPAARPARTPDQRQVTALARALAAAHRPVFIAGTGARVADAAKPLEDLADACGALLSTSAPARGLFLGSPWNLDVSGGFASPLAAELISGADVIVGWGCSLNMWTTRHGALIDPQAWVAQVDIEPAALGAHRRIHLGVSGDVAQVAAAVTAELGRMQPAGDSEGTGYRSEDLRERIAREVRWRDVPYADEGDDQRIDPRTLSIALDDMLPAERQVAVDSGNFMGYPSMYLSVPDASAFCFTQAYQSVGLGLATAIGAAIAHPDRLTVAALGDGGALMGISELETAVRLSLPMVIVVYDDEAYGAEVHHFGPSGFPLDTVRFPPADIAAIARGYGCTGITVRSADDLAPLRDWLAGPRSAPIVIDAKVASEHGSWWLEEAFRSH
jgi:acetolactate synthase I/II/III large subunit